MKLICFYTNKRYSDMAGRLLNSAWDFGIEGEAVSRPDVGEWTHNVNYKPSVILEALIKFEEPVLYVDADAEIKQYPKLLDECSWIGAAYHTVPGVPTGGTLYFKPGAERVLKLWADLVKASPKKADDFVNLKAALLKCREKLDALPPAYCWHEKTMRRAYPGAVPVIEHFCVGEHTYETR